MGYDELRHKNQKSAIDNKQKRVFLSKATDKKTGYEVIQADFVPGKYTKGEQWYELGIWHHDEEKEFSGQSWCNISFPPIVANPTTPEVISEEDEKQEETIAEEVIAASVDSTFASSLSPPTTTTTKQRGDDTDDEKQRKRSKVTKSL